MAERRVVVALRAGVALFFVAVQCVVVLSFFTTYTGGTLYSPYSQPLFAMALLSPLIAKGKETVLLMFAVVVVVFLAYADWLSGGMPSGVHVPVWLYVITPLVSTGIALMAPVFGITRPAPLEWVWLSLTTTAMDVAPIAEGGAEGVRKTRSRVCGTNR